ncbi:MAG: antitoxin Xre-like helix-turn-helix domain-containing protein [Chthoniobacterales bacterium]
MKKAIKAKPALPGRKSGPSLAAQAKTPTPKKDPPKKKPVAAVSGLAFQEFEALRRQLDLSHEELSARLGLSRATVEERKAAGRLTSDESGKVVSLLAFSVHLFGDPDEARVWLKTPQRGLRGAVPLDYA